MTLKRHPGVMAVFPELSEKLLRSLDLQIQRDFAAVAPDVFEAWQAILLERGQFLIGELLSAFAEQVQRKLKTLNPASPSELLRLNRLKQGLENLMQSFWRGLADAHLLFGDQVLLESVKNRLRDTFKQKPLNVQSDTPSCKEESRDLPCLM